MLGAEGARQLSSSFQLVGGNRGGQRGEGHRAVSQDVAGKPEQVGGIDTARIGDEDTRQGPQPVAGGALLCSSERQVGFHGCAL